jgi:hypothetical protein
MFRLTAVLALSLLSGCTSTEDTFIIKVEGTPAESAVLYLDTHGGVELPPIEGGFRGTQEIRRESSGVIIVYFDKRPPVVCEVGYAVNGLSHVLRFRIDAAHEYCHDVDLGAVVPHDRATPET